MKFSSSSFSDTNIHATEATEITLFPSFVSSCLIGTVTEALDLYA